MGPLCSAKPLAPSFRRSFMLFFSLVGIYPRDYIGCIPAAAQAYQSSPDHIDRNGELYRLSDSVRVGCEAHPFRDRFDSLEKAPPVGSGFAVDDRNPRNIETQNPKQPPPHRRSRQTSVADSPRHEEIRIRAYEIYIECGAKPGHDLVMS